ncbi:MAG TPA: TIGR00341 family protein [Cyanothece sp. UBA12306]|nr:TIGR00341 family protein [Cyanothece sp. UBA12306]
MILSKFWSLIKKEWQLFQRLQTDSEEQKISEYKLSATLIQELVAHNFSILLTLATAIATFGLLSDSSATIIGAMIIAPLMIPIIGFAYSLVILNHRLIFYSLGRLIFGIILTIFIAFITTEIIGFRIPGAEILSRTEPTLLDLGVAIAAGTAGAFAKVRPRVSDAIPGVAIAVALVPPLCVVGIGLAIADFELSTGSFILFLTNLLGIILMAALVFILDSYGSWKRAILGLLFLVFNLLIITLPLNFSFQEMITENRVRHAIYLYVRESKHHLLRNIQVQLKEQEIFVIVEVIDPSGQKTISNDQQKLKKVQDFIEEKVGKPINLKLRVFPIEIIEYNADATDL